MNEALAQIGTIGMQAASSGMVVFLRIGAALAVLPVFGERSIPTRVRLALAIAFTIVVAPAVSNTFEQKASLPDLGLLYVSEPIIGLAFGISVRLLLLALQTAGSIAAQSTSLAQIMGGANTDPQPAIGHVLMVAGLALAVMLDLHILVTKGLILTYHVFPVGTFPSSIAFSDWGVTKIARAFSLAFSLAAPFIIVSLIYNVALGVINRAMPQLMVAFVGAPAITAAGLILLFLAAPLLLPIWQNALELELTNPFGGW